MRLKRLETSSFVPLAAKRVYFETAIMVDNNSISEANPFTARGSTHRRITDRNFSKDV